jgi:hypothetical protein
MIPAPPASFLIRCPKLGHQIHFGYCEREQGKLPCSRALNCWYGIFNVVGYFKERLDQRQWEEAFSPPTKSKLETLIELIEKAKKRGKSDS